MMGDSDWVPEGIDVERPSSARVYDYYLGGAHNFAVDRQMAEQALAVLPDAPLMAQAKRAFLRRAVEFLVERGIRQFLDIGSGIPTVGHVHEITEHTAPDARVVYVDLDPVAVSHSRQILKDTERAVAIQEDVRRPEQILDHPEVAALLDFSQPVAVLVVALFHFVPDEAAPADLLARLTAPLAPGSYLVISHATSDAPRDFASGMDVYRRGGIAVALRSRSEIAALFGDFELVEPGLVWVPQWRPESPGDVGDAPESSVIYAGVGHRG
jgi:hypothetical protein